MEKAAKCSLFSYHAAGCRDSIPTKWTLQGVEVAGMSRYYLDEMDAVGWRDVAGMSG